MSGIFVDGPVDSEMTAFDWAGMVVAGAILIACIGLLGVVLWRAL